MEIKQPESYASWNDCFADMRALAQENNGVSMDTLFSAWSYTNMALNPFVQNRRVKAISSLPLDYNKDQIAKMIVAPNGNEKPLRETAHALDWSAYPFHKIKSTYQDLNSYHFYHYPAYIDEKMAKDEKLWREGKFLDKFNHEMKIKQIAREIVGTAILEGKVAYVPRWHVDKSHNQVGFSYMQQLPSDWWKIIGGNSTSKYTVMFDMLYFLQPGTDWRQFGDLFEPFVHTFDSILEPIGTVKPVDGLGKKIVYSTRNTVVNAEGTQFAVNTAKFEEIKNNAQGNPQLYNQNGKWAYWVTLPVDKVWVFEIDDTTRTVASPLTGLFLAFDQLAALEEVQMAILQNPLVQIALGEIPYRDDNGAPTDDPYKLSPSGRRYFENLWYQMLQASNTGGIGFFAAPVENFHMETLTEAPNANNISTSGYQYAINKAGLAGLIPISDNPRAGAVELSATLEERFTNPVYSQFMNMMNSIYKTLGMKYDWRFEMFGGLRSDIKELETAYKGMHEGILSETFKYLAMRNMSLWTDMSKSHVIMGSGMLDLRIPMISSYSISDKTKVLPPKNQGSTEVDVGGRPKVGIDEVMQGDGSEQQEKDIDTD